MQHVVVDVYNAGVILSFDVFVCLFFYFFILFFRRYRRERRDTKFLLKQPYKYINTPNCVRPFHLNYRTGVVNVARSVSTRNCIILFSTYRFMKSRPCWHRAAVINFSCHISFTNTLWKHVRLWENKNIHDRLFPAVCSVWCPSDMSLFSFYDPFVWYVLLDPRSNTAITTTEVHRSRWWRVEISGYIVMMSTGLARSVSIITKSICLNIIWAIVPYPRNVFVWMCYKTLESTK